MFLLGILLSTLSYKHENESHYLQNIFPFQKRDYSLAKPAQLNAKAGEEEVELTWKAVEGVGEYAIYRKEGEKGVWQRLTVTTKTTYKDPLTNEWELLEETASLAVDESDESQEPTIYTYTVVPYYRQSGEKYYGNFEYLGVSVEVQ